MKSDKPLPATPCPDCGHTLRLGFAPRKAQRITCPYCWAYLQVVNIEPLELSWDTEFEDFCQRVVLTTS